MKKIITIVIILLLCVGFGYFLFKISPEQVKPSQYQLDTSGVKQVSAVRPFDPATDHYQGNPGAKNVFIEYGDFQCPYCAQSNNMLNQVSQQFPDTVFVFRYYPLVEIHKNTVLASLAAEAASTQGKFWQMHDLLFGKQSDWENSANPFDTFVQYAQTVGVSNIDQFKNDVTSQKYKSAIEKDNNEALGLGLKGTPTYFVNGHNITAATDINTLKKEAEQYLTK